MSNRGYPRIGTRHKTNRSRKQGVTVCDQCGGPVNIGEVFEMVDIQWTYMRGDDDVATICKECGRSPLQLGKILGGLKKQEKAE